MKFTKIVIFLSLAVLSVGFYLKPAGVNAATDCGDESGSYKASQGWSCMDASVGKDCVQNHCLGASNIQCCKSGGIIPNDRGQKTSGDYKLNDFVQLAVNVAKWIEGIVGSLALLMFIYGGFVLLLSQGASDKVTKGKSIITGAVIGLVIVFVSWAVINFIMGGLTGIDGAGWATTK